MGIRRFRVKSAAAAAVLVLVPAALAACSSGGGNSNSSNSGSTGSVTLATLPDDVSVLPVYLGLADGSFKDAGIDVKLQQVNAGSTILQSVVAGAVNLGASQADSVIKASQSGAAASMNIANVTGSPTSLVTYSTALLKRHNLTTAQFNAETPQQKLQLLKGATVATFGPGGLVDLLVSQLIKTAGLSDKDVTRVTISGSPQELAALQAGKVDAIVISPPQPLEAVDSGKAVIAGPVGSFSPLLKTMAYESIFVRTDWANSNSALLKSFAKGLAAACTKAATGDPGQIAQELQSASYFSGIDAKVLAESIKTSQFAYPKSCAITPESMTNLIKFDESANAITGNVTDPSKYFTNQYLPTGTGGS